MCQKLAQFAQRGLVLVILHAMVVPLWGDDSLKSTALRQAQPYIDNEVLVGMTIGLVRGQESETLGLGRMSVSSKLEPDGDTIYEIGSMSKVFTGILLADAVVQGKTDLQRPAQELLGDRARMPIHDNSGIIRLRHLATHTSGLPRLPDNFVVSQPDNPYADYSVENLYAFLNEHQLSRAPGASSEYSNLAAGLLGHLLALSADATYEELLIQRVTTPLKLPDTTITLSAQQRQRLATPHVDGGAPTANWDIPTLAGAGAIRSTTRDMVRFIQANLQPPDSPVGQAIELAWKVHQTPLEDPDFALGLGWHVARDGATRWHNGQTGGYHSMMLINRQLKSGVVVLSNTATGQIDRLAEDLLRAISGAAVAPRKFERTVVAVAPDVMERYVGRYQLAPKFILTVSVKDNQLLVGATGQPTVPVFPRSDAEWFYKVVEATLTFQVDDAGECQAVELFQNGARMPAKRID